MRQTRQKREAILLDGTPDKRMYWSIISDYDIPTGTCELVDNAIDRWLASKSGGSVAIELAMDPQRQLMRIKDSAGGVKQKDLRLLIAPGASANSPDSETIGIFGVGSKRAVVALAESASIKTRYRKEQSFQIDITKDWLETEDWELPCFEIPEIEPGVTIVELTSLRKLLAEDAPESMQAHLGEVYGWFLRNEGCKIAVNGARVHPKEFDEWAYPPHYPPRSAALTVNLGQGDVRVEIVAGLIRDRDPELDNYGVYVYCNNRLVAKELKVREVGYFVTSEAGVPHPDASLCRAIVRINGPAKLMPWNSSKSGINYGHPSFTAIRPTLIQLVSHFSSLSRRLKDDWDKQVFRHLTGEIVAIDPIRVDHRKRLLLPPLPRVNRRHFEELKAKNRKQIEDQPWTLGLVEAVAAVDIISRQKLETRNRIALILLDSNFEIALKEFVVHRDDLFPPKQYDDAAIRSMFARRHLVIDAVSKVVPIPTKLLDKAKHYYALRNKLIHERATAGITDADVGNYLVTIQRILKILFKLRF